MRIKVSGFCPVDVEQIYKYEKLNAWRYLKGDYTIEIIDGKQNIYITDFGGTQTAKRLPRNHTIVIEDNRIVYAKENVETSSIYYAPPDGIKVRDSYDEFFAAIDNAVKLRCSDDCWITMSSGHDSGTIVASALHQNLKFNTLTVKAHEDMRVVDNRLKITDGVLIDKWNKKREAHEVVAINVHRLGGKVLLTGLGADEYLYTTDYQLASNFIKESDKFYNDRGIQRRYPLLDPEVFFMYHALHKSMKKKKIPLIEYMKSRNFPYRTKEKIPFYLA